LSGCRERARSRRGASFKILYVQTVAIGEHVDVAGFWRIEFISAGIFKSAGDLV
jgi:hypothetical protein